MTDKYVNFGEVANDLWDKVLLELEKQLKPASFETWFRRKTRANLEEDRIKIIADGEFQLEWIESRYSNLISDIIHKLTGRKFTLQFVLGEKTENDVHDTVIDHLEIRTQFFQDKFVKLEQLLIELKRSVAENKCIIDELAQLQPKTFTINDVLDSRLKFQLHKLADIELEVHRLSFDQKRILKLTEERVKKLQDEVNELKEIIVNK